MKDRIHISEQLDQLELGGETLNQTLRELSLINRLLGNHLAIRRAVWRQLRQFPSRHWRIIDLGCGGGDVLRMLYRFCQKKGVKADFIGIDGNPYSLQFAQSVEANRISYVQADILQPHFQLPKCDLLVSSHFLYHLSNEDLLSFLDTHAPAVGHAWLISELERSRIALTLFRILGPIMRLSPLTRSDGKLAIKRAFTYKEMKELLQGSSWQVFHCKRAWAFRMMITLFSPTSS